jgi:hypothetical protein
VAEKTELIIKYFFSSFILFCHFDF